MENMENIEKKEEISTLSKEEVLVDNSKNEKNDLINKVENEIIVNKEKNKRKNMKKFKNKKNKTKKMLWPVFVLILTLFLSLIFSLGSEFLLSGTGLIISFIVLVVFLTIAVLADMLGVAITAADIEPFLAMSSRKVKGSKIALKLVKNSEKLASVCCDVIGDICGILSGTVGATITLLFAVSGEIQNILIASVVSAVIASLTVFLKAVGKSIAIKNANSIVLIFAKFISFFKFGK